MNTMIGSKFKKDMEAASPRKLLVWIIIVSLAIRFALLDIQTHDFQKHLEQWYAFILENGKIWALEHKFSNYNVPYLYLLVAASYLLEGLSSLHAVKTVSMFFDFVIAFFVYKIVSLRFHSGAMPCWAFGVILLSPAVIVNSSIWAQSDVIYTAFLVMCFYFLCVERKAIACIAFGLAVSFKLQAMFLAPLLFILLIRRELSWRHVTLVPVVFIVCLIPAWLTGRPFEELIQIYLEQYHTYGRLTLNAPNIYQWVSNDLYAELVPPGFLITTFAVLSLSFWMFKYKQALDFDMLLLLAIIILILVPFLLPKMHERYFYPADIFSIVFAFNLPRYWPVPVAVVGCSFFSYSPHLLDFAIIPLPILSIVMLVVLVFLLRELKRKLENVTTSSSEHHSN
ncbi:MAG: hypothetical protein AAF478_08900 [Pseudomonadota bacterium]